MSSTFSRAGVRRLAITAALGLAMASTPALSSPVAAGVIARYAATRVLPLPLAAATNRIVSSCADDGSAGTLRAAVGLAGSGDTIDLTGLPGVDPACTDSTITLTMGEIAVAHNLNLLGPSDATLVIAAGGKNRVLNSTSADTPTAYLQVTSLTISGGANYSGGRGGCISATGEVRLDHATVTDCVAYTLGNHGKYQGFAVGGGIDAYAVSMTNGSVVANNAVKNGPYLAHLYGGGISTAADFTCTDSTVTGNSALFGVGGGVAVSGNLSLTRCTVDTNSAIKYGGGIFVANHTAQVSIDESTVSGNIGGKGGGIYSRAPLAIANSTIAFNEAGQSYGGGIQSLYNVALVSTIVARNTNGNSANADVVLASGKTLTGSNNLIMSATVNPPGVIVSSSDPQLAPLGNHGGLTRTHALLPGSPAIDAGNNTKAFATDQRGAGFVREVPIGKPDIGAYERQAGDDEIFADGFD